MDSFSIKLANGKYIAKLYFAETYEGINRPGERVFSFKVHGKEFKDFDIWKKAGGPYRVYVETVPVEVTSGEFRITFTPQVQNPEINGIEIIPLALVGQSVTAQVQQPPAPLVDSADFRPTALVFSMVWMEDLEKNCRVL